MKLIVTSILLILATAICDAHDYWLSPSAYVLKSGEELPVRLFVGDHFNGEIERPLSKTMTVDFLLHSQTGIQDLVDSKRYEKTPVAKVALHSKGTQVISMQRDWARIEMEGKKFHEYLKHEGLQDIIDQRIQAGEAEKSATERYRRYLKSIVSVENTEGDLWKRRLGHKLEIIPLTNPAKAIAGDRITFQITLDGKPLKGVQVAALGRTDDKVSDKHARTDSKGEVNFEVDHSGEWIVRLVHLRRCSDQEADWESFWAALTFFVPAK